MTVVINNLKIRFNISLTPLFHAIQVLIRLKILKCTNDSDASPNGIIIFKNRI